MGTNGVRGERYQKKMETIRVRGAGVETIRTDVP
jgi:hypothetical protein